MQIKLQRNIMGGPYVEFAITKEGENFQHWQKDSLFLEDGVYEVFSDCFGRSNRLFNYYGPTLYTSNDLVKLKGELQDHVNLLNVVQSASDLQKLILNQKMGRNFFVSMDSAGIKYEEQWQIILDQLREVGVGLVQIIDSCLVDNKVLWVLGV